VDTQVDDYKDVYASDEDIERKYQKAPVEVFGKPGEIASTWYSTAIVMDALEAVERDLRWLLKSKDSIPAFAQFLEIKTLPKDQMKKILQGALKGAGFHRLTQKLLVQNLIDEGELHLAPEVAAKFLDIMRAHRKEVDVTLTFASLPDKKFMENVMDRIKKYKLRDGQQPVWKFKINPELLGGYHATAPQLFTYDFTVKAQNEQLKEWHKNFESFIEKEKPAAPIIRE
jgi:F0F1-type ATP synthase delta subunit